MKLVKAGYEILTPIDGEQIIIDMEAAARTCYQSEGKIEIGGIPMKKDAISGKKLVKKLITLQHGAMIEFGQDITVKFTVDRGVSHELVRHRIASFAQESTRYCNYGKDEHISFIIPEWLTQIPELETNNISTLSELIPTHIDEVGDRESVDMGFKWAIIMLRLQNQYLDLLKFGNWTPQQARSVLPNSLKTVINVKANLREWRHIFNMRCAKTAHPQMREVMVPLLEEFKAKIPVIFDDLKFD